MSRTAPFAKIKYESSLITFTEVPDEVSLCLNISGCPCFCQGCFEPWLQEDIGTELTYAELERLILKNPHITCVCFMGGDRYYDDIATLITELRCNYPHLKWAMYSGRQEMQPFLSKILDYYKIGPYIEEKGPLDNPNTNQIFYKKENNEWINITYRFQTKKV